MKICRRPFAFVSLAVLFLRGFFAPALAAETAAEDRVFPVRVSANARHLVDATGKPFLLHGDTAWSLMAQLSREDAETYLENRRQKGFNAVLANLVEQFYADNPPANRQGDAPFTTPGDFSTPNEAYFAHTDWVIRRAGEKGILVVLNPCYTGFSSNHRTSGDGWIREVLANGPEKCRNYGRYLGLRYKGAANIIWQAGGDTTLPAGSDAEKNWLEILRGIKDHAPSHLWTAHWYRFTTARDQAAFAPFMDVDNGYGGCRTYIQTLRAYNRAEPRPTFINEAYYEDTTLGVGPVGAPDQMRAKAYWAILSGATGQIFGSDHVWGFGGPRGTPGRPQPRLDWRTGMDRQPSREMALVKRLFEGVAWHELVPDQDHAVVTGGYGTFGKDDRTAGGDYVTASLTGDGRLVMAYAPPTGIGARTFTVNMAQLRGPAHARWFNPTTGASTEVDGSPLANAGSREFTTPGDNGTGANDWVLVLEAGGARNFTAGDSVAAKFGVHEIALRGDGAVANPFDTVATVTFTPPSGAANAKTVSAFFDGENTWRARVYVSEPGEWSWSSQCATDRALADRRGVFRAADSRLPGRLLVHPKNPRQWMTEDGRWFLHLSDTAYFLLCARDGNGDPVTDDDARRYLRDATARGITAVRCFLASRSAGFAESRDQWTSWFFPNEDLDRLGLENLQLADRRLRMLLDANPGIAVQLILFPQEGYARDGRFWAELTPVRRERLLRNLVARFAAYPQVFWLFVNDAHYGEKFPNNNALAREAGAYLQRHDPWQHPRSTGHARRLPFAFGAEDWATYIHLEHAHDLGAGEYARHATFAKPVFLGEDRYEQDHAERDPLDMRYWQRRLFWSWLLAGGAANYGGRWWAVHPYGETADKPAAYHARTQVTFTKPLAGLDSVRVIRDYFADRRIELSDFSAAPALVRDADGRVAADAPNLMRRGHGEFLAYHPNSTSAGRTAQADPARAARLWLDLNTVSGWFEVEWLRAHDGVSARGATVEGGRKIELAAPWIGHDVVVRLVRSTAQPSALAAAPAPATPVPNSPARAGGRNLAGNPGFESDKPEPWTLSGTGAGLTENGVRSGRTALRLVPGTRAVQILRGLEPGALYVARGWLHSVQGKAEMTYAESHKPTNGKNLFAGAASGTGKYELTTLLFRPELDPANSRGQVDVKFSLYTEDDKGEALMDDIEIRRADLAGPDLLGIVQFDQPQLARWNAGTTEPVIVPDGGRGGGPCLRLTKKGYCSLLLEGLEPNTTYAATAWLRGTWFRFGAGRYGHRTDHISINTPEFVPRTIGFTTGPDSKSVSLYFLMPADNRIALIDSVEVRRVELH